MDTVANKQLNIALLGPPNVGKTSLFNQLTGLQQKVGNFPGVTVEKKVGKIQLQDLNGQLTDLPGLYSLFAKSPDEEVVIKALEEESFDALLLVLDASHLERSLLLAQQALATGIPVLPLLNMLDQAEGQGFQFDTQELLPLLGQEPLRINARQGLGLDQIPKAIDQLLSQEAPSTNTDFLALIKSNDAAAQLKDSQKRLEQIRPQLEKARKKTSTKRNWSHFLDQWTSHPIAGYLIYLTVLFGIFQLIFSLADWPMGLIDEGIGALASFIAELLPPGPINELITEGIIPGIGGVVIFVPQIAILFFALSVLEESGYISRVVFLMDKPMRFFGLSGQSVLPLLSAAACAIPAVMAARNISSWRERMATIFISPMISCAARLPVYVILIALVIPDGSSWGFGWKGLAMLGLYLLGVLGALLTGLALRFILPKKDQNPFVIDLPSYKWPRWQNVFLTAYQKSKSFVLEAGKVILALSILLWILGSYGPTEAMQAAEERAQQMSQNDSELAQNMAAEKLSASYLGHLGHAIEPAIRPLGYDWKIGIGLLASFAAREVFVGTMGTIYSMGSEPEENTLIERMRAERFEDSQKAVYSLPTGISLLVFYVFAMQCMSTLAVVYKETRSWKWPLLQLIYMTGLAYLLAFLSYQLLS